MPDLKLVVVAPVVTWVASALAGAIDEIAIAKPATKSNEAFIAMSSQKLGREMPIPEGKIARLRHSVKSALVKRDQSPQMSYAIALPQAGELRRWFATSPSLRAKRSR